MIKYVAPGDLQRKILIQANENVTDITVLLGGE